MIGQLRLGGAERQLSLLAAGLKKTKYSPLVIALSSDGDLYRRLREAEIETYVLPRRSSFDLFRVIGTVQILRRRRPAIIHSFDFSGNIYGKLAGALAGTPVLIGGVRCAHALPRKVALMEKLLHPVTDAVISNSVAGRESWALRTGFPRERIFVVPNGLDATEMRRPPGGFRPLREVLSIPEGEPIIGCVGSIYDLKNPLMFVEVATCLVRGGGDGRFVWIGDGPMRGEMEDAIRSRHLAGRVHLMGQRSDARWLARGFDVGILTSDSEGMPNAVMEYMFWGLPIVVTDAGDCPELIEHGRSGLVVEKGDTSSMARCIRALLADPEWARALGSRARKRVVEEFSSESMLSRTLSVYGTLLR